MDLLGVVLALVEQLQLVAADRAAGVLHLLQQGVQRVHHVGLHHGERLAQVVRMLAFEEVAGRIIPEGVQRLAPVDDVREVGVQGDAQYVVQGLWPGGGRPQRCAARGQGQQAAADLSAVPQVTQRGRGGRQGGPVLHAKVTPGSCQALELRAHAVERGAEIGHALLFLLHHGGRGAGHEAFVAQLGLGLGDLAFQALDLLA